MPYARWSSVQVICGNIIRGIDKIRIGETPLHPIPSFRIFLKERLKIYSLILSAHHWFSDAFHTSLGKVCNWWSDWCCFLRCFLSPFLRLVLVHHNHLTFQPEFLPHEPQTTWGTISVCADTQIKKLNPVTAQHCISLSLWNFLSLLLQMFISTCVNMSRYIYYLLLKTQFSYGNVSCCTKNHHTL